MSLFDTFSKSSEGGSTPTGGSSLYDSFTSEKGLTTKGQKRRYSRKTRKDFEEYNISKKVKSAVDSLPDVSEVEPEPTFMKKLGEGIIAGGKDLASTVGTGVNEYNRFFYKTFNKGKGAFGEEFDPVYKQDKAKLEAYSEKTQKRLEEKLGKEGADSFTVQASRALGQGIGQIVAYGISPVLGTATISAQVIGAGKNAYDTAYESSIAQGKSEEEAKRIANINGIVTGVVNMAESIPLFRTANIAKKALTQPLKTGAKDILARVAKTGAIEAGTEGLQQAGEDITAKLTYDKDRTVLRNAITATLISIPTGILFGGAGEVNVAVRNRELMKAKNEVAKTFMEGGTPPDQAEKVANVIVSQYAILGDENAFDIPKPESTKEEVKPVEQKVSITEMAPETVKAELDSIVTTIKTSEPVKTTFKPAELNKDFDKNPVSFKEGDIVIDTEGNAQEIVSGNAKWIEDKESPLRDTNIGIVRTRDIGDKEDFIGYANQLRHATESEINQIKLDDDRIKKVKKDTASTKSLNNIYRLVNSIKAVPFKDNGNNISFQFISDSRFDSNIGDKINEYISSFEEKAKEAGLKYTIGQVRDVTFGDPEPTDQKRVDITIQKPQKEAKTKTQAQKVKEVIKEKPKSIKEIAEETKILEPNIRRILGVGEKEGTFERVDKGVYILKKDGEDIAFLHTGDAVETLPKLIEDGFKSDMVFLDIPYDTPAVKGGNRGVKYNLLSVADFSKILDSVKKILRTPNSPIIHMYSQAESGLKAMQKYNELFEEKGFVPVGKGEYQKTFADGSPVTSPNGKVAKPEGILVFTQSGELNKDLKNLNFKLVRPKGYQTEKPAEMLKEMIEMTTEEGDVVLDPFAGSGVTGEQAIKTGRKAVLIEKNKEVAETVTKPRIKKAVEQKPSKQTETVGTVIPDSVEELARNEFGKSFEKLSKPEIKKVLKKSVGDIIIKTSDESFVSKLATSQYDKSPFNLKPELVFKGLEEGVFTDTFSLISKPDVAKKLLNEYIDKNKPEKPSYEMQFPDWKSIVPTEKGESVEVKGYVGGRFPSIVLETKSGDQVLVGAEKWVFMKKYLPDADVYFVEQTKPIVFKEKGKTVGLLMPIYRDSKEKVSFEEKKPKFVNRSGGQASPLDLNKTTQKLVNKLKGNGEPAEVQQIPKDFKISEEAKKILLDMGIPYVAEKSLGRNLAGVYKNLAKKVRVQSLYDLSTVLHEGTHGIDDKIGFTKKLISDTKAGAKVRKQLTDIYVDLYPSAKRTHKLRTRLAEGLAVLFENYFYDPAFVQEKYPDLVNDFIKPDGKYHHKDFTTLLSKMNELVESYAKLSPEQRIGSRIRTGKEVIDEHKGFTAKQRIIFEALNKFEPLNRYAKTAGVKETWEDPTVQAFTILRKNSIISNWIYGERKPILKKDGNWDFRKGTVEDYMKILKTQDNIQNFRSYLVARRVVATHNELANLQNAYDMAIENAKAAMTEDTDTSFLEEEKSKLMTEIERLSKVIKNDDFSLQDATAVVEKYSDQFAEAEKIYDSINNDMIDFMYESDLIDKETADEYKSKEGYTSFQRYIDETLDSTLGTIQNSTKSKVSSLRGRTGSTLDIIDPLYSQVMSINETIVKGLENRLWERVDNIAQKSPELASRFEKLTPVTAVDTNGKVSFPQEKDPSIIRFFKDGKREFRKAPPEMIAVMKTMRGKEFDGFAQLLRIPSSLFSRLTTTANPFFAVTNFTVDQFSALTNTKTGYKPIVDPAKGLTQYFKHMFGKDGSDGNKIAEYLFLGGERQTLAAYQDLSPEDLTQKLAGKQSKIAKVGKVIDASLGVLETPSNFSEIMTRFGEYRRSVEKGEPMSVAMYRASEISTPFELRGNIFGSTGQAIVQSIPYFNAALQVLYKFARTGKSNPKRVATIGASLLAVSLSSTIAMMAFGSDEHKRLLAQQPAKLMAKNMFFPSPNGKDLIRLRVPEQFGSLIAMVQLYVISQYDANKATFNDYIESGTSFLPQQLNILQPEQMVISWLPQAIKPTIETALNKKTYPNILPIVPEYLLDKPKSEQYTDYTSEVAKFLGELTNSSPMLIDFWVREQFGVVGGLLLGKMPNAPLITQEEKYVTAGRSYNQFYDTKDILEGQYLEMKSQYEKDPSSVDIEKKMDLDTSWAVYEDVSKVIADMRDIAVKESVPEEIRDSAYSLLLKLNYGEDPTTMVRDVLDLQSMVIHEKVKGIKPDDLSSEDRTTLREAEVNDKLYEWEQGTKNQTNLTKLENEIARTVYGSNATKAEISTVRKEFGYRRYFGYENQWADRIYKAQSNADKVEILKEARKELGVTKFRDLYYTGRKTVTLATGRPSYILISDDLRDLYFGK